MEVAAARLEDMDAEEPLDAAPPEPASPARSAPEHANPTSPRRSMREDRDQTSLLEHVRGVGADELAAAIAAASEGPDGDETGLNAGTPVDEPAATPERASAEEDAPMEEAEEGEAAAVGEAADEGVEELRTPTGAGASAPLAELPADWRALLDEPEEELKLKLAELQRIAVEIEAAEAAHAEGGDAPAETTLPLSFPTLKIEGAAMAPPRRAQSAWGYFIADKFGSRPSKEAGATWKALAEEEKQQYVAMAGEDKTRFKDEIRVYEAWDHPEAEVADASTDAVGAAASDPGTCLLPISRIRTCMKLSGELDKKKIHKEAAFAVAKCAELFIEYLAEQSLSESRKRGKGKTVGKQDFGAMIYGVRCADQFEFMHEDFPRTEVCAQPKTRPRVAPRPPKPKRPLEPSADVNSDAEGGAEKGGGAKRAGRPVGKKGRGAAEAPAQKNTMTNFFSRQSGPWQPPAEADARRGSDDEAEAEEEEGEEIAALASRLEVDDDDDEEVMIDPTKRHRAAARPARRNVIEDDDDE